MREYGRVCTAVAAFLRVVRTALAHARAPSVAGARDVAVDGSAGVRLPHLRWRRDVVVSRRLEAGAGCASAGRSHDALRRDSGRGWRGGGYLATYLLPLLAVTPRGFGDWAAYMMYGAVAAVVFVRTDLALVNPTLYVLGWRVVSAIPIGENGTRDSAVIVVCRDPRSLSDPVDVVRMAGCLVTKRERGQATAVSHLGT